MRRWWIAAALMASVCAGSDDRSGEERFLPSEFVARVEVIDPPAQRVIWVVECGSRVDERFVTDVDASTFEYETNVLDPTRGRVVEVASQSGPSKLASIHGW